MEFIKPRNLDGNLLEIELKDIGISLPPRSITVIGDFLYLDVDEDQKELVQQILDNHVPKPRPEPTVAEKLQSMGLSLEDLKSAFGLIES